MLKQERGEIKGNLVDNFIEQGKELLKSQAQVTELREAAKPFASSHALEFLPEDWHDSICELGKALASTGQEQLAGELVEVEGALESLDKIARKPHYHMHGSIMICRVCEAELSTLGHTETCELAALKKKYEARRKAILEGMK